MRWDLTGCSLGDSPKESGSSLAMRREITEKKTGGLAVRFERQLDRPYHRIRATTNKYRRVNRPDGGWTARTTDYGRRPTVDGG
ncbi:hypothetical protein BHM03_00033580 [Ensete ventricosum]|nr:hypothetical protein BHM03_00033580 [Ensete ventricosum]